MSQIKAVATQSFVHRRKRVAVGDALTLNPKEAKTYANINYIELEKEAEKKVEAQTAPPEEVKTGKQKSR